MAAPKCVIFDCDGVLVDSEVIACRVDAGVLAAAGYPITEADIRERFVGISSKSMMDILVAETGIKPPADLAEQRRAAVMAAFEHELLPISGIAGALETIKAAGLAIGVASSSSLPRIERALELTGLRDFFGPHIYSASMVANGKPAPDLFLHAARAIGFTPADCLVIEDAVPGVQGARAAVMDVYGFTGGSHCGPGHDLRLASAGATLVMASMDALVGHLGLG
jgi:HAD superfamily hydrolase (TIGR01509 family)